MKEKLNIGIVGGSGYTGLELVKILNRHAYSHIEFVTSRSLDGKKIGDAYPSLKNSKYGDTLFVSPEGTDLSGVDVVFLCLPPHKSMEFVKGINGAGKAMIIDIGSDFRLKDPGSYIKWYGKEHMCPELLKSFTYGIPEINTGEIAGCSHIANPGCYPTSVLLGLAPLLKSEFGIASITIDSKSGVSGAGKKLEEAYLFGSLDNNFYAYSPSGHRHIGEMEQEIEKISGSNIKIDFTPHLLPVSRGIFSTIYCKIAGKGGKDITKDVNKLYEKYYRESLFVQFVGNTIPKMKDTLGTNMCLIGTVYDSRTATLKIFSTLDNLIKGAAGQAVQNMNLAMGLDEDEGLKLESIFS